MDDGGPAFPANPWETIEAGTHCPGAAHLGMSLRDWFAGQALKGIVSNSTADDISDMQHGIKGGKIEAMAAYAWADAMLEARKP